MEKSWDPRIDHLTTAIWADQPGSDDFVAVAWRGPSLLAIEFYEIVSAGADDYHLLLRETRFMATPTDYPNRMPPEALDEILRVWIKTSATTLPVYLSEGTSETWSHETFSSNQAKNIPFGEMYRRGFSDYSSTTSPKQMPLLTQTQVDELVSNVAFLQDRRWTSVQAKAHLQQLQAVAIYVRALEEGKSPIGEIATLLKVNVARARNLVQFARDNQYLTGAAVGRVSGAATRSAIDLAESALAFTQSKEQRGI